MSNQEIFCVGEIFESYNQIDIKLDEYLNKTRYQFVVKHSKRLKDTYGKSKENPKNRKLIYEHIHYKCANSKHHLGG